MPAVRHRAGRTAGADRRYGGVTASRPRHRAEHRRRTPARAGYPAACV